MTRAIPKNSAGGRTTNRIDLSKPGETAASSTSTFGVGATRELGSFGGVGVTEDVRVDIAEIASPQKISGSVNVSEQSAQMEVELGVKKGFGVSFGGEIKRTPTGIEVNNVSFGVNALGFGVNAEGKGSESSKIGISGFGAKVEVASDKDGNTSVRLGFELPGFGWGITLQPDGEKDGQPIVRPPLPPGALTPDQIDTGMLTSPCGRVCVTLHNHFEGHNYDDIDAPWTLTGTEDVCLKPRPVVDPVTGRRTGESITSWDSGYVYEIYYPEDCEYSLGAWDESFKRYSIGTIWDYYTVSPNTRTQCFPPPSGQIPKSEPANLPNYPQEYTPMNCCDKIEEMYKYFGIAKLKKHKMKIAKAFLAPGGKGTEDCEDYYEITQALFRMLANGLIINPKSKPLGSEWQNTNATAWASSMYEMMAETMSDGNTSQRFEIAAMMQLAQMMAAIAESTRKIEFVADGLGFEPNLVSEQLPVCFTIYEKHKGFGKFDPKKINVSNISTDEQVERILGTMLNPSKIPIVRWQLKSGETTIKEQLNG